MLYEDPERLKRRLSVIALDLLGEANDIAGPAVGLASDAGRYITGQNLVANGGETIRENLRQTILARLNRATQSTSARVDIMAALRSAACLLPLALRV